VFEANEADGIRLPKDQAHVDSGNVLLVTQEDYLDPRCGSGEGSFSTWYIPYTDADLLRADNPEAFANTNALAKRSQGKGKVEPLDSWNTELLDTGRDSLAGAVCSAHYFDYHQAGFVAQGWYQQGLRILDVRNPADIKQVGYYFTGAMETFAANWVPEYDASGHQTGRKSTMLYTQDPSRGLEFFTFSLPETAPEGTEPLRTPVLPQLPPGAVVAHRHESCHYPGMILPPRRRPAWISVCAAAIVLLSLAVAVVVRYQPLQQAGVFEVGKEMQVVTVDEFEEAGAHILRYVDGDYVTYAFTVRNTGPVGVTVTGLELPDEAERRMLQTVTTGIASGGSTEAAAQEPFEPFALRAGEEQRLVVQARLDNCEYYTERAIEILDRQTITFRAAGIARTATITFDRPLLVRSPTIQRCPERTLDRSEHRRTEP
jgi:hypothetical protein